jgi:hypothetical protein
VPHDTFHAVSIKTDRDPAAALSAAMATVARLLRTQFREAEKNLESFHVRGVTHSHTLTTTDGQTRAAVTAIASYAYI